MKVTLTLKLDRVTVAHLLANGMVPAAAVLEQQLPRDLVAESIEGSIELSRQHPDQVLGHFRELLKTAEVEFQIPPPPVIGTVLRPGDALVTDVTINNRPSRLRKERRRGA